VRHTKGAASIAALIGSGILIAMLSACSSGAGNSQTLDGVKSQTLSLEREIAAYVPARLIAERQQTTTSRVIFACPGHSDESYWPGSMNLSLKKPANSDAVLSAIAANWTNQDGWEVFKVTDDDGNPSLDLKSPKGYSFTVAFSDGPSFTINSLSACFPSSGMSGRSSY
jgi:hypothetical protein